MSTLSRLFPALLVLSVASPAAATDCSGPYRPLDGTCANHAHPEWGKNETVFVRANHTNTLPDRTDVLSGTDFEALDLPSPRRVSNAMSAFTAGALNPEGLSVFFVIMGQFIAHDLSDLEVDLGAFPVTGDPIDSRTGSVPGMRYDEGDPGILDRDLAEAQGFVIDGDVYISMHSNVCHAGPGGDCEALNRVTHLLDGSNIYGSDDLQAAGLRSFEGGRLKTADYDIPVFGAPPFVPPVHVADLPQTYADGCNNLRKVLTLVQGVPDELVTCVGDSRGHENVMLTAVHVVWMREHNRRAAELAAAHADWDDETLYQEARAHTVALYQSIVYNDWLPSLLGSQSGLLGAYSGYTPSADPRIDLAFSTAVFRFGHTMVPELVVPRDACLDSTIPPSAGGALPFAGGTGGPFTIFTLLGLTQGIDTVLLDMALTHAFAVDPRVEDSIRDIPGSSVTFDTLATNLNRARMSGIETYTDLRAGYLHGNDRKIYGQGDCPSNAKNAATDPVECFAEITSDPALAATLADLYGKVTRVDAWVGVVSEDKPAGSILGPTAAAAIADQFARLRDGDRYYFENGGFDADTLDGIRGTTLAEVVQRNTGIALLPPDVLVATDPADWDAYTDPSCE